MDLFFNAIKGQFNSLNFLIFLALLTYFLFWKKKKKAFLGMLIFTLAFFLLTSTNYLPSYLVSKIENQYKPFHSESVTHPDSIYIHSLGGGYTLDDRLPANSQLSLASLSRLAEAIRIFNSIDKSVLVVSGNVASGNKSLASVNRDAAIAFGIAPTRIRMLESPATTREEAREFAKHFGRNVRVVVVTDAVHIPRAMKFFKEEGLDAYAAPTNFQVKHDENPFALRWVPSIDNFELMDRVYREFFASIKSFLTK